MNAGARQNSELWAITSYYNPAYYHRRRHNYRAFVENLGVPLLAVELGFDGRFDLQKDDADILVQFSQGDVMWQKERLLNLAHAELPEECRFVAWIDCDVIFEEDDWPQRTIEALDRDRLVQLFDRVDYMPADWTPDHDGQDFPPVLQRIALGSAIASGVNPEKAMRSRVSPSLNQYCRGFAWAARRGFLEEYCLYDECIMGGGDTATMSAALGCIDYVLERNMMHDAQKPRYLAWAKRFGGAVERQIGAIGGTIRHLWHGSMADRCYGRRYAGLLANAFNPAVDLTATAEGPWQWSSPKPELHEYVASYFETRREDN